MAWLQLQSAAAAFDMAVSKLPGMLQSSHHQACPHTAHVFSCESLYALCNKQALILMA